MSEPIPLVFHTCPRCSAPSHIAMPGEGGSVGALIEVQRDASSWSVIPHPHFTDRMRHDAPAYLLICEGGCPRAMVQWAAPAEEPTPR